MNFGSDNHSGTSEQVLETMMEANHGFTHGYGDDAWTRKAAAELQRVFECELDVYFVATGTAANCLALSCLAQPWQTILCHAGSHILIDESTAPEFFTGGARLVPISGGDGKLSAGHLKDYFATARTDVPHNALASVLSFAQASETGLLYSPQEIGAMSEVCKSGGLAMHMDGARFANALVAQNCTPAELTWKSGVDALCLGATKCGALCAEAVVFFNKDHAAGFEQRRKRSGHLVSKGRLFGAQFAGWLRGDHWLDLARHSNSQAALLSDSLQAFDDVRIAWPVQSNQIFAALPRELASQLRKAGAEFYDWYPQSVPNGFKLAADDVLVRLVTSFLTTEEHRQEFVQHISDYFSSQASMRNSSRSSGNAPAPSNSS